MQDFPDRGKIYAASDPPGTSRAAAVSSNTASRDRPGHGRTLPPCYILFHFSRRLRASARDCGSRPPGPPAGSGAPVLAQAGGRGRWRGIEGWVHPCAETPPTPGCLDTFFHPAVPLQTRDRRSCHFRCPWVLPCRNMPRGGGRTRGIAGGARRRGDSGAEAPRRGERPNLNEDPPGSSRAVAVSANTASPPAVTGTRRPFHLATHSLPFASAPLRRDCLPRPPWSSPISDSGAVGFSMASRVSAEEAAFDTLGLANGERLSSHDAVPSNRDERQSCT